MGTQLKESSRGGKPSVYSLARRAQELRISILEVVSNARGGHVGGAYSIIDVMVALYSRVLKHDPSNPAWPDRDRLIFSKGHGCLALYSVLAEAGYFPKEWLAGFCVDGGILGGHPEREAIPGVEVSSGSLGHGLSIGIGIALAAKIDRKNYHTYVVISDGELNEGSTWEALISGAQFKLDNLTLIVDSNKYISLGTLSSIMNIEPLCTRLRDFGWEVAEMDGHCMEDIVSTLENRMSELGKPRAIVANTVKGKGVSFMENVSKWHYRAPNKEEEETAYRELRQELDQ
jgi:transketolase